MQRWIEKLLPQNSKIQLINGGGGQNLDLGLEKERRRELRREEETGGERRGACGGDERGVEALAADISDRESEPRQAIVAASFVWGKCEGFRKRYTAVECTGIQYTATQCSFNTRYNVLLYNKK